MLAEREPKADPIAASHPEWLRPSTIPITVVCGPVASGKSTYVREHSRAGELMLDLDLIVARLNGTLEIRHDWDRGRWLFGVLRERNRLLGQISRPCRWPRAWLIVAEPAGDRRQWWADKLKPESVIVFETHADVCIARIKGDPERVARRSEQIDAIHSWWREYTRRPADVIMELAMNGESR
jgi:5-methylcytosine-specific restriction protein A